MEFILELLILMVVFDSAVSRIPRMKEVVWVKVLRNSVDTPLAFLRAFLSYELQEVDRLIFIGILQVFLLFM